MREKNLNLLLLLFVALSCYLILEIFFRAILTGDSLQAMHETEWFRYGNVHRISDRNHFVAKGDDDISLTPEFIEDYAKSKAKYRIAVIGDSFTQGIGLFDESKRFTRILQEFLGEEYFVINLGWGGADIDAYKRIEAVFFGNYSANLTIIAYFPNDIEPDIVERRYSNNLYFLSPLSKHSALAFYVQREIEDELQLYLNYYAKAFSDERNLAVHRESLHRLIDSPKNKGSDVMLVSIPFFYQLKSFEDYPLKHEIKFLSDTAEVNGAYFLDLYPAFQGYLPKEVYISRFDQHPNELGHRLIAEALYQKIVRLNT